MRLNRFLAACGVASRRGAESLILAGRVQVNGRPVTELATFVEPGRDRVELDRRPLSLEAQLVYYLLHKPPGVVTTADDPEGRAKVLDLVPATPRVFPVGRLDRDTSGALLLTNDGALAHRLIHPRYKVEKEYLALVEGPVAPETLERLRRGVSLDGRVTAPALVTVAGGRAGRTRLRIVIGEGRKRQIRRMGEEVGHPILELHRVRIGPVTLGDLEAGTFRVLSEDEVRDLRRQTARAPRYAPPRSPRDSGDRRPRRESARKAQ